MVGGGSFLEQLLKDRSASGNQLSDLQLAAQANTFTLAVCVCVCMCVYVCMCVCVLASVCLCSAVRPTACSPGHYIHARGV